MNAPAPRSRWLAAALFLALAGGSVPAASQLAFGDDDRVPLGALLEVIVEGEELFAFDAQTGGTSVERLRVGETVLWSDSRGLLAVVITDQRILAIATRSSRWQSVDYERREPPPRSALLGDRVALVPLARRVLGFLGTTSRFSEERLGPHQELRATRVGANVGIVVTDREALGLSPSAGGFFPIRLQLKEKIRAVEAASNLATVRTSQRILVFRSPSGTWAERRH
ncbi:MAG: hypothetical protein AAF430_10670 [Myxococcota bacterium]